MRGDLRRQRGQVTILALGLSLVGIAVVGLAIDAARVWVHLRTLQASADAAAVSGASGIDVDRYYQGRGTALKLDVEVARARVASLLRQRAVPGAAHIQAGAKGVRVSLRSQIETSFLSLVGIRQLPVTAEAVAQPFFGVP